MKTKKTERDYDFSLVINGVSELTGKVEDAFFEAGCDDATLSIRRGHLYAEFSRNAPSMKDAILSAIRDIRRAKIGASVLCVDECNLVTQAEIARRIKRTRQMVNQYISGDRGPGDFPAPEHHLGDGAPLWRWSSVSAWLADNDIIRREDNLNAEVVAAVNTSLEHARQKQRNPELVKEISEKLNAA
jgi:hypothetical protein